MLIIPIMLKLLDPDFADSLLAFQPVGESFSTYSDAGLLRNSHHSRRMPFNAPLTRLSR